MKKGLILEGGAMRGMFTAGVLDVLMENGIEFDGAVGVSAGATFGCNFKSRQIGRTIRYNKKYCRDWRYCSIRSLIFTGDLYGADFCYKKLPEELDVFDKESYKKNPMDFYCVVSDCDSGKPLYKKLVNCDEEDLVWMRASASMPLVSRVVKIDGHRLLDGGMTDSIPLKYFESQGYDRNLVVLTQPRQYQKKPSILMWLMKILLFKYPKLVQAMSRRHILYNETTAEVFKKADEGKLMVICPKEALGISRTEKNPEELERVYQHGRQRALEMLPQIKSYLA